MYDDCKSSSYWTHTTQHLKLRLDRFRRFFTARGRDQHTDRHQRHNLVQVSVLVLSQDLDLHAISE